TYNCTEKTLKDLIQLKASMHMSLPTESTADEFTLVDKDYLLPTVPYSSIVRYHQ
ncbi:hypothetical protein CU097_009162, partial [Rhizopus azygosporus]